MKTAFRWLMVQAIIILVPMPAGAGSLYTVDWSTIDGGGGSSSGGVYTLSGTVGQPDAARMSGGPYTLDGGFWGIVAAVQTSGSPPLSIVLSAPGTVVVSWPYPSTGFQIQENPDVVTTNWSNVVTGPAHVGDEWRLTVSLPVGSRFYRLYHP